jgi:hypothetical protein
MPGGRGLCVASRSWAVPERTRRRAFALAPRLAHGLRRSFLSTQTDAAARQEAIAHFRAILLETTQTETEKMQESVSWAKFGENSLKVGKKGWREGGRGRGVCVR